MSKRHLFLWSWDPFTVDHPVYVWDPSFFLLSDLFGQRTESSTVVEDKEYISSSG